VNITQDNGLDFYWGYTENRLCCVKWSCDWWRNM